MFAWRLNNVLGAQDREGGCMITKAEYADLRAMIKTIGLEGMDNRGDYYTWSNKLVEGIIYSRIDHVL